MPRRPRDAIATPDQENLEAAAARIDHELIESGPARFQSGDSVRELLDDLIAALGGELAQILKLALWVLVDRGDPQKRGVQD